MHSAFLFGIFGDYMLYAKAIAHPISGSNFFAYMRDSSAGDICFRILERLVKGIGGVDEMKKTVMKVIDWAMALGCFVFFVVWGIMAAGASMGLWAIGIKEDEVKK